MTVTHPVDHAGNAAPASSASTITNPVRRGPILLALHGATSSPAAITIAQVIAARLGLDVHVVSVTAAEPRYPSPLDIGRSRSCRTGALQ